VLGDNASFRRGTPWKKIEDFHGQLRSNLFVIVESPSSRALAPAGAHIGIG